MFLASMLQVQFNSIQFIKIYKFAPCKVNYIIYYKNDYKLDMFTPNRIVHYNIVKNYKNFNIIIEIYIYIYICHILYHDIKYILEDH